MAIREKIRHNATAQLRPGEQIQSVFVGQTTSQWWMLVGWLPFLIMNQYYTVVVTDQRALVCSAGKLSSTGVKSVERELPRETRIGPASGLWYKTAALGEPMYIHKRWHRDIEQADSLAGLPEASLPPQESAPA